MTKLLIDIKFVLEDDDGKEYTKHYYANNQDGVYEICQIINRERYKVVYYTITEYLKCEKCEVYIQDEQVKWCSCATELYPYCRDCWNKFKTPQILKKELNYEK